MSDGEGRVFLLLQGPFSYFFTTLAATLRDRGAATFRLLVCPGDILFHRGPGGGAYRGRPEHWRVYVESFMKNRGVTDLICLGDGRRWHQDAIAAARDAGVRIHIVEQGYMRPHWLTIEPDGTGGRTRFPRDWSAISTLAQGAARARAPRFETSFVAYAAMDVGFNLANLLTSWLFFPNYRRHSIDHPVTEWTGWIWNKAMKTRRRKRRLAAATTRIDAHDGPLYILPLQLETDYQIRLHAPAGGVEGMLRRVIRSFAAAAPSDAILAVKVHPLDHGWTDWRRIAARAAGTEGCADRVVFFDGGDLDAMLSRAAGVVVANSTVGLTALQAGAPVIALGDAIYDLPGLTFQGDIDGFWEGAKPPHPGRLAVLTDALTATIQVPGGFDGGGAATGAANVADRALAPAPYRPRRPAI